MFVDLFRVLRNERAEIDFTYLVKLVLLSFVCCMCQQYVGFLGRHHHAIRTERYSLNK